VLVHPIPVSEKSLAQLHTTIRLRAQSGLATVRMIGAIAPFAGSSYVLIEEELAEIVAAVEQAERLECLLEQALAGARLPEQLRGRV
jgi:hypothetical protein